MERNNWLTDGELYWRGTTGGDTEAVYSKGTFGASEEAGRGSTFKYQQQHHNYQDSIRNYCLQFPNQQQLQEKPRVQQQIRKSATSPGTLRHQQQFPNQQQHLHRQ